MESCYTLIGIVILALLLSPSILQGLGVFGTDWIENSSCSSLDNKPSCCNRTYYTSRCKGSFELSDLDSVASRLHAVAFWILLLPILCLVLEICCTQNDGDSFSICALIGGFCFLFYPIAGLLSFIGCMIIVGKYPGHTYGISFKRSLASGLLVLIATGILIFFAYMKKKNKQNPAAAANYTPSSDVQSYETPGAAAPYGGHQFQMTEMTHASVEHTAVEHGGFYHFITRVNVIHTVLH
ncbi:hypothetical protein ACF0H5_015465 [Mactra antiquata]